MSRDLETVAVEISKPKSKLFLINFLQRPPDFLIEIFNNCEKLVEKMDSGRKEVVLIGDFNCYCSQIVNNNSSSQTKKLVELTKTL